MSACADSIPQPPAPIRPAHPLLPLSAQESDELLSSGTELPRRESLRQQQRRARQDPAGDVPYDLALQSTGVSPAGDGAADPVGISSGEVLGQVLPWDELDHVSLPPPALGLDERPAPTASAGQAASYSGLTGPFHQASSCV